MNDGLSAERSLIALSIYGAPRQRGRPLSHWRFAGRETSATRWSYDSILADQFPILAVVAFCVKSVPLAVPQLAPAKCNLGQARS
jgi:hypothetical protein